MNFLDDPWFRTCVEAESALYSEQLDHFNSSPEFVEKAVDEYEEFFRNPRADVPRNVAFMWRIHMMHPRTYRADCKKAFGKLVVPFYADNELVPQLHTDCVGLKRKTGEGASAGFASLDLAAGMRRQFRFMRKMANRSGAELAEFVDEALERFRMWFALIKRSQGQLVPTMDIDLIWHSLMLCPGIYYDLSMKEIGYFVDHKDDHKDDPTRYLAGSKNMNKLAKATAELWSSVYGLDRPFYKCTGVSEKREKDGSEVMNCACHNCTTHCAFDCVDGGSKGGEEDGLINIGAERY